MDEFADIGVCLRDDRRRASDPNRSNSSDDSERGFCSPPSGLGPGGLSSNPNRSRRRPVDCIDIVLLRLSRRSHPPSSGSLSSLSNSRRSKRRPLVLTRSNEYMLPSSALLAAARLRLALDAPIDDEVAAYVLLPPARGRRGRLAAPFDSAIWFSS